MGVSTYRGQIVCDKRWPDGTRMIRVCANKTKAKQLLDQINGSIADGSWREFREKLRLRDRNVLTLHAYSKTYLEDYSAVRNKPKTWKRKITSFNSLNRFLGKLELESITSAHLHHYIRWRKRQGVSEATINRELATLKHLLNYAEECSLIEHNPVEKFRKLREPQKQRPRFMDEQIDSVLKAVRPDCQPVFILLRETGCRREEALSLQHWQIQGEAKLVVFSEDTKSRKYRYVPLAEAALDAVDSLPRDREYPYVFYNPATGTRWHDCRKPWEEARKVAGLPGLLVKDLRRHFAIGLAEAGADMHDIQQVLEHSSVSTTEKHYAQFSPTHSARKILRVLEGGRSAKFGEMETKRKHGTRVLRKAK